MDVRGPADFDGKNRLQERRELTRIESTEGPGQPKSPQLTQQAAVSELAKLGQQLKAIPEVRAEIVEKAVANVKDGKFATRQSAEKTAQAILEAFGGQ